MRERERERERKTDRQTDRQRQRQRDPGTCPRFDDFVPMMDKVNTSNTDIVLRGGFNIHLFKPQPTWTSASLFGLLRVLSLLDKVGNLHNLRKSTHNAFKQQLCPFIADVFYSSVHFVLAPRTANRSLHGSLGHSYGP